MRFRIMQCALAAALFFTSLSSASAGIADIAWTGNTGNDEWTDPGNWNLGGVYANNTPVVSYNASFPGFSGVAYVGATKTEFITVNSLNTGATNSISVVGGSNLSTGVLTGQGEITVIDSSLTLGDAKQFAGIISLASSGVPTLLQVTDGAVLNGEVFLGAYKGAPSPLSGITGVSGVESITNLGTISGLNGFVGNMNVLTNNGLIRTVDVQGSPSGLEISSYKFDNTNGTLTVAGNAPLQIASHFANYDGTSLSGGTYNLSGNLILPGATLNTIGTATQLTVNTGGAITGTGGVNLLSQVALNQGTVNILGAGNNVALNGGGFVNTGSFTVDQGAQVSSGAFQNGIGASASVYAGSTLNAPGLQNDGTLTINGTADFRGGGPNSFVNLNPVTETLTGGTYNLGPNGTMLYDAGSGAHGGAILNINQGTSLTLARGGQLQYGLTQYDALAVLTSNAGSLALTGGDHSFAPVGGTFLNTSNGELTIGGGATARIYGDLVNGGSIGLSSGSFEANNVSNSGLLVVQNDGTGPATATFFGTLTNDSTGDISVGSGSSPAADTVTATDILNSGDLSVALTGFVQATDNFTQTDGSTTLRGGVIESPTIDVQGGVVKGFGQLQGDVDNSGGTISPINGAVEVTGSYTQDAGGTLNEGLGSGDYMFVDDDAHLSGLFKGFDATGGAGFTAGESFDILHFDGSLFGNFTSFDLPTIAGLTFREDVEAHDIFLDVMTASPTPEPSSIWLTGGGALLLMLGWRRSRRQSTGNTR